MKHPSTPHNSITIAILVDGAYFLKRYPDAFRNGNRHSPQQIVENLYRMLMKHCEDDYLYRIIYYDCAPLQKKAQNPISKKTIDFAASARAKFRLEVFEELKKRRKVALRLGQLRDTQNWLISPRKTKELLDGKTTIAKLTDIDVFYEARQKGVDMKIGLDIASIAYKRLVHRIILVAGDADFVPAAKLARREGIDFVLDPMWNHINTSLHEHIDGLKSTCEPPHKPLKPYPYIIK